MNSSAAVMNSQNQVESEQSIECAMLSKYKIIIKRALLLTICLLISLIFNAVARADLNDGSSCHISANVHYTIGDNYTYQDSE